MKPLKTTITARFHRPELTRISSHLEGVQYKGYGATGSKLTPTELLDEISDGTELLILEFEELSAAVIASAPKLRLIGCCRTGPEASVDIDAASSRGIPVLFTPGRNAVSVAEYTIGLMLSVTRHIARVHHLLRYTSELTDVIYDDKPGERRGITSEWSLDARAPFNRFQGPELSGKTAGMVGFGAIGREIARRLRAFDMDIVVYDPYISLDAAAQAGVERVSLDDLVSRADYVVMGAKVTPETVGMFSAERFARMKATAYFINTARAALVDYGALEAALRSGAIRGAAVDVYPLEPVPQGSSLLTLDNIVLSPHLAGASTDLFRRHSRIMVDQLELAFAGRRPPFIKNPEAWERSGFAG